VIFTRRKIGELREGYEASFLVLKGNPIEGFANVRSIHNEVQTRTPITLSGMPDQHIGGWSTLSFSRSKSMRKLCVITLVILALASWGFGRAQADKDALRDTLINLEKQSWVAWQGHDGRFFQSFLSDDHIEVGFGGLTNKATVVGGVASPICVVKSYVVDKFELTVFDTNTALLNYHAAQDTTCNGTPVPSPVWVSSLYVKRNGHWLNVLYQQTQTNK
jgi:hypothetical protein